MKTQQMKLSDIMKKNVVTVDHEASLWEVKMVFNNTKFHHLLVTESKVLIGVLSDRDYLKAVSPHLGTEQQSAKDTATLNTRVHTIMSRKLHTLTPEHSIMDAVKLFNQQSISCIPIVNSNMSIAGIVSWRDIMRTIEALQA